MAKQYITYEPIDWADGVEGGTPVNAGNLGRMEDAIKALVDKVNDPITIDDIGADAIGADQIVDGAVGSNKIANDSVGSEKLTPTLRDSLSRMRLSKCSAIRFAVTDTGAYIQFVDDGDRAIFGISASNSGAISGINYRE